MILIFDLGFVIFLLKNQNVEFLNPHNFISDF
jgi:hypothetical protein